MTVLCGFVLIILTYINSNCLLGHASEFKNETDKLALLAFKDAITMDPNGVFKSWNTSLHHCHWPGISCSNKHHRQRVTLLDLPSHGLVGSLSAHIGNLSFLSSIFLDNNSFHGEIPLEIGKLFRLRFLYLNNNSFHGEIPENLTGCRNLREMNLIDNNLTGKLPVELGSLTNLKGLGLTKNNFKGKIPAFLGNLSSLIILSIAIAMWEGPIPNDLGRLTKLKYLLLFGNNLTGTIPSSIYNLSSLIAFSVTGNRLEGNLPSDIGFTLPNLQILHMSRNRFTGVIPISLSNASNLEIIGLTRNSFSGQVPQELGRLVNISWIGLGVNTLGTRDKNDLSFISYLTNCTKLEILIFAYNLLKGPLPNSIANLSTQIYFLSIGMNHIYGTIPSGIGNLVNLNFLGMSYMMLQGNIPDRIGNLQKLSILDIQGNQLVGPIPPTIGNLTVLYELWLWQNNLSGIIPPSLGNCSNLLSLDLSTNGLNGSIPASIFGLSSVASINLSHNSLAGTLPLDVGNLKQLGVLDVSKNNVSGSIPNTLGSCLSLTEVYMNGNLFEGTIPDTLSSLRGLDWLDLSHNKLTGMIPEKLGNLPLLKILNLSFNDLEGEVPKTGIFKNTSVISLIGNRNLCGGVPELKLPACIIPQYSNKRGISLALIITAPLIVVAVCLALLAGFFILRYRRNKSRQKPPSTSLGSQFNKISYRNLLKATDGFSSANLIGFGTHGSVYRGFLLQSQSSIAVKVFNLDQRGASKSFISECKALRNIRHRNLLKILSVCSSVDYQGNDFRAVISELVPGGNLEKLLHTEVVNDEQGSTTLNLMQRLNIVIDVASALEYLHCDCQPPIVHSDLKPSNVLLDDDMVAHVGDFGLARVLSKVSGSAERDQSSSIIKGSIGYVAPEYGMGEGASIQGDVYSFGILVLEIFTTRRPTDGMFQGDLNLHNFTMMALPERVMDIVDPQLLSEDNAAGRMQKYLISVLRVGLSCSVETPRDRMEIRNAVRELHLIKKAYEREASVQPAMQIRM